MGYHQYADDEAQYSYEDVQRAYANAKLEGLQMGIAEIKGQLARGNVPVSVESILSGLAALERMMQAFAKNPVGCARMFEPINDRKEGAK